MQPAKSESRQFTYQTRLVLDSDQDCVLCEYAALMGRVERTLFADLMKGKTVGELKAPYLIKYGMTARQFNAVRTQVEGKIASIKELRKGQLQETKNRKKSLIDTIEKLEKKNGKAFQIHQKRRRLAKIESKILSIENQIATGKVTLCFGSRALFHSQFHLEANKFNSHQDWLKEWAASRNNSFFILGSKDETAGNQTCTATLQQDSALSLKLRLPNALSQHGKYLQIQNVKFNYGHGAIIGGLERCKERKLDKNAGVALSYRYKRDKKGWTVFVSLSIPEPSKATRDNIGVIGVDINANHLALVETDRFGNPVYKKIIPLNLCGKKQHQTKAMIQEAAVEIVNLSQKTKKPIVLEELSFQDKKTALHEGNNKKYSRMLSSFAYSAIIASIKSRAWRFGVQIKEVNPAYTSTIGRVKFAKRYGLSIHESAALCIARRFLRVSERLPRHQEQVPDGKGGHVTLPLPVRNRGKHVWSAWRVIRKKLSAALVAHFRAMRNRSSGQRQPASCDSEFSNFVGETQYANR